MARVGQQNLTWLLAGMPQGVHHPANPLQTLVVHCHAVLLVAWETNILAVFTSDTQYLSLCPLYDSVVLSWINCSVYNVLPPPQHEIERVQHILRALHERKQRLLVNLQTYPYQRLAQHLQR